MLLTECPPPQSHAAVMMMTMTELPFSRVLSFSGTHASRGLTSFPETKEQTPADQGVLKDFESGCFCSYIVSTKRTVIYKKLVKYDLQDYVEHNPARSIQPQSFCCCRQNAILV